MPDEFKVTKACNSTNARLADITLLHGKVQTPIFLPVGSQATVRSLTPHDMDEIGIKMILCNAYHLYLRPGVDLITKAGGLHRFMGWDKPILSDSGGYQIFSLSSFRNITEEGVVFRSHIDGSQHHITPEKSIEIQQKLGADIIMALDVCPDSNSKKEKLALTIPVTTKWAERCCRVFHDTGQKLFGIIQGGIYSELRKISAEQITALKFSGYAIGGLSLGESKSAMWDSVDYTVGYMPGDKPRYLMGVGSPEDIFEGVSRGIDIFDSALPTRVARNGALYTHEGRINIKRSLYRDRIEPIETACDCFTCSNFTTAYLHHLFKCDELLAYRLATIHNLFFMNNLLNEIRNSIKDESFSKKKLEFLSKYQTTQEDRRIQQKMRSIETKRASLESDF